LVKYVDCILYGFEIHKHKISAFRVQGVRKLLVLDKETERLVNEVKKELRALKGKARARAKPEASEEVPENAGNIRLKQTYSKVLANIKRYRTFEPREASLRP